MRSFGRLAGIATVVATLLLSAACTVPTAGSVSNATTMNPPKAPVDASRPEEQPSSAPSSSVMTAAQQRNFGQTYEWENGLAVIVAQPVFFVPGTYGSVQSATGYLRFTVSIANNSDDVYEPILFSATVQSGNQEGDRVFDVDNSLTLPPNTAILPGRQSTFDVGFGVNNPQDVVMEVSPGLDYKNAFFVTSPGSAPAPVPTGPNPAEPNPAEPNSAAPTAATPHTVGDLGCQHQLVLRPATERESYCSSRR